MNLAGKTTTTRLLPSNYSLDLPPKMLVTTTVNTFSGSGIRNNPLLATIACWWNELYLGTETWNAWARYFCQKKTAPHGMPLKLCVFWYPWHAFFAHPLMPKILQVMFWKYVVFFWCPWHTFFANLFTVWDILTKNLACLKFCCPFYERCRICPKNMTGWGED